MSKRVKVRRGKPGETEYSEKVPGARGNYGWFARFDLTDGFVGITQGEGGDLQRVLLSPGQIASLVDFVLVTS